MITHEHSPKEEEENQGEQKKKETRGLRAVGAQIFNSFSTQPAVYVYTAEVPPQIPSQYTGIVSGTRLVLLLQTGGCSTPIPNPSLPIFSVDCSVCSVGPIALCDEVPSWLPSNQRGGSAQDESLRLIATERPHRPQTRHFIYIRVKATTKRYCRKF